jgi:hypothetical protein
LLTVVVVAGLAVGGVRADQIDKNMVAQADQIAAAVGKLGVRNVAVLKFEFKAGAGDGSFTAGTVNARMATRLENLLILTNDPKKPRMILSDAGLVLAETAERTKTPITWRTQAGRKQIAQVGKLPLAWDDSTKLAPDGFVTGEVVTAPDYQTTTVRFYGFTTADPAALKELYTLDDKAGGSGIRTDRGMLASFGQSFNLTAKSRSLGMEADDEEAAQDAAKRDQSNAPPVAAQGQQPDDTQSPVRLQIFFDGKEQPWAQDKGEPRIAVTPGAKQKVHFVLTNTSATESYGVLLAVNGKNTNAISNDSLMDKAAHEQRKWVLGPKDSYKIEGFYINADGKYNPFEVLPEDESARAYDQLNPMFRGKISLLVFGKRAEETEKKVEVKPEAQKVRDDTATATALDLGGGAWKIRNTGSLVAAQKLLKDSTHVSDANGSLAVAVVEKAKYAAGKRGLLAASGETRTSGEIKKVAIEYDPLPMCCVHVVYYVPAAKGR